MTNGQRTKRRVDDNMLITVRTKAWNGYPLIHKELEHGYTGVVWVVRGGQL